MEQSRCKQNENNNKKKKPKTKTKEEEQAVKARGMLFTEIRHMRVRDYSAKLHSHK